MKQCCFCLDLRSGTIASAVFILVTRSVAIALFSSILILRQNDKRGYHSTDDYIQGSKADIPWYYQIDFSKTRLITTIGVSCLHLLFSILLLIGVKQKNKSLLSPWIVLLALEVFVGLGFVIMTFVMTGWVHAFPRVTSTLIGISLQCYMLCCVTYYYKQLAARENNTIYNVIPLNSHNVQNQVTSTTTTPFYNNAGLYYNTTTSLSDQPPKYENISPPFKNAAIMNDKPPSYDDIKMMNNDIKMKKNDE